MESAVEKETPIAARARKLAGLWPRLDECSDRALWESLFAEKEALETEIAALPAAGPLDALIQVALAYGVAETIFASDWENNGERLREMSSTMRDLLRRAFAGLEEKLGAEFDARQFGVDFYIPTKADANEWVDWPLTGRGSTAVN